MATPPSPDPEARPERHAQADEFGDLRTAIAHLTAEVRRIESDLRRLDGRMAVLESAIDALEIPLLRDLASAQVPPASVTVTADMPLAASDGFYNVERAEDGEPYRWTGSSGGEFCFTLVVDRSRELVARLGLWRRGPGMTPDPEHIECVVDGRHLRALPSAAGRGIYELRLPERPGGVFTRICFTTRTGPTESEKDNRELGVPFRFLVVEPAEDA